MLFMNSSYALQGTISDCLYETSPFFFPNPPIFLHTQRELHCNNLQQLAQTQFIFRKARPFFELIIAGDNQIKPVFLQSSTQLSTPLTSGPIKYNHFMTEQVV